MDTLDEEAANNLKFKRVYEAYKEFQQSYAKWGEMTEKAYQKSRGN